MRRPPGSPAAAPGRRPRQPTDGRRRRRRRLRQRPVTRRLPCSRHISGSRTAATCAAWHWTATPQSPSPSRAVLGGETEGGARGCRRLRLPWHMHALLEHARWPRCPCRRPSMMFFIGSAFAGGCGAVCLPAWRSVVRLPPQFSTPAAVLVPASHLPLPHALAAPPCRVAGGETGQAGHSTAGVSGARPPPLISAYGCQPVGGRGGLGQQRGTLWPLHYPSHVHVVHPAGYGPAVLWCMLCMLRCCCAGPGGRPAPPLVPAATPSTCCCPRCRSRVRRGGDDHCLPPARQPQWSQVLHRAGAPPQSGGSGGTRACASTLLPCPCVAPTSIPHPSP